VRKPEPWFKFAEFMVRPPVTLWFNWRLEGLEHIPPEGPLLVAANHISYFDPLAHALLLLKAGRRPRFLTKSELYGNPFMRRVLEGAHQIRVERGSGSQAPIDAARDALKDDQAVVIYPEATITRNPDHTPMQGKTGIARLALGADVPVLPVAVWGSQHVWQRDGAGSLKFGRPIWVKAGPALDFSEYDGRQDDPDALRAVTDTIMDELTRLVNDLRSRFPKRWAEAA
jgi:1-acyl-sn-glycerol-3-phosphate acyltransferase